MKALVYAAIPHYGQILCQNLSALLNLDLPPVPIFSPEQLPELMRRDTYSLLVCYANYADESWRALLADAYSCHPDITLILIGSCDDLIYALGQEYSRRLQFIDSTLERRVLEATLNRLPNLVPELRSPPSETASIHVEAGELKKILTERYWQDILNLRIPEPGRIMPDIFPPAGAKSKYQILSILFPIKQWPESCTNREKINCYADLKRILTAMLFPTQSPYDIILELRSEMLAAIMVAPETRLVPYDEIITRCDRFLAVASQVFHCALVCYIGTWGDHVSFFPKFDRLLELDDQNVYPANAITLLSDQTSPAGRPEPPNFSLWAELLTDQNFQQASQHAAAYFQTLQQYSAVSTEFLYEFEQDFAQMFAVTLQQSGSALRSQMDNRTYIRLMQNAVRSISGMERWVMWCLQFLESQLARQNEPDSAVARSQQFIENSLSANLSCEAVAANVYLSPSHLSRLFKKETGQTLKAYIAGRRLAMAKTLLTQTDLSITEIAMKAGYNSYSYFAGVFRSETGLTPTKYRSLYGSEDRSGTERLEGAVAAP